MFRKKTITRQTGEPYLIRRYLIKTKLFQVVIHKILKSDDDCLHDHPWNFISIILKGGYWEGTTPEQVLKSEAEIEHYKKIIGDNCVYYKWYGRFNILFRKAEWKHRLKLAKMPKHIYGKDEIPCTTLVIMFKRRREWGFFTKNGFVKWFDYKSTQNCE